ncbi:MAG: TIGR03088 family PEP-CTERM/XrtA system glycosyltransferase [Gammaproteobacteria bacterium]|nr:TIGR03088 family PEP-CTERM/XrtA system glycosyltransferase [Gammaproteobacteria bacterium]
MLIDDKLPLIAHVIFRLDVGGLENGLVNLINGLPPDRFRHAIICINDFTNFKNRIQCDDVEIIAIHKKPGTDLLALWRLYKVFRRLKPKIVHTRNLAALDALLPAFLARVRGRIHSEHGWDINDLNGQNRKLRWLRRMHSPLVHRYIALSKDLQRYLIEKVGIDADRIDQLYNGVDTDVFEPPVSQTKGKSQLSNKFDEDSFLIGTVSRMHAVKDPLNLVNAFISLNKRSPSLARTVRLVMIGDGPLRKSVLSLLDEAELSNLAWVPGLRDDVPRILRALDVFIQPSLAEGVSNTILEAMASGVPVIATDVGGNSELLSDGVTGMIVDRANATALSCAIEKYVNDPNMRVSHGASGRKRAEDVFGMSVMLNGYLNIYDDVASHVRSTPSHETHVGVRKS